MAAGAWSRTLNGTPSPPGVPHITLYCACNGPHSIEPMNAITEQELENHGTFWFNWSVFRPQRPKCRSCRRVFLPRSDKRVVAFLQACRLGSSLENAVILLCIPEIPAHPPF